MTLHRIRRALTVSRRVRAIKAGAAGMYRWCMTCTDLTDACHPGDEQLAKEFVLDRHLGEKVVDFVVLAICFVPPFSDHVCVNKTGLCEEGGRESERESWWWKWRKTRIIDRLLWKSPCVPVPKGAITYNLAETPFRPKQLDTRDVPLKFFFDHET